MSLSWCSCHLLMRWRVGRIICRIVDVVWERRKSTRQSKSRGDQPIRYYLKFYYESTCLGHVRGVHTKSIKNKSIQSPIQRASWGRVGVGLSWVCILFLSQFCLFVYLISKLLILGLIRSYVSWRMRTRLCPHPYGVSWCLSLTFFLYIKSTNN